MEGLERVRDTRRGSLRDDSSHDEDARLPGLYKGEAWSVVSRPWLDFVLLESLSRTVTLVAKLATVASAPEHFVATLACGDPTVKNYNVKKRRKKKNQERMGDQNQKYHHDGTDGSAGAGIRDPWVATLSQKYHLWVVNDHLRYIDWGDGGRQHPKTITLDDVTPSNTGPWKYDTSLHAPSRVPCDHRFHHHLHSHAHHYLLDVFMSVARSLYETRVGSGDLRCTQRGSCRPGSFFARKLGRRDGVRDALWHAARTSLTESQPFTAGDLYDAHFHAITWLAEQHGKDANEKTNEGFAAVLETARGRGADGDVPGLRAGRSGREPWLGPLGRRAAGRISAGLRYASGCDGGEGKSPYLGAG